jgi:Cu+-exporting ATPase
MERDVVCGMQVEPAKAAATSQFGGKTYYFCSKECKQTFDANPSEYARQPDAARQSGPAGA